MRQLLLLVLALSTVSLVNAQVYVDADAMGTADGSSWANAYTDLGAALAATTSGEIWVAEGTYTPGADSTATFAINSAVSIYGGFDGTESSIDDRDVDDNPTVLSGDNSGDDVTDDFDNNRTDNARHIVTVDSLIDGRVRIDGFTISGGNTTPPGANTSAAVSSGGGILAFSTLDIANCTFTQNSGAVGSATALFGPPTAESNVDTDGSTIIDCSFSDNFSEQGISFITSTNDLEVRGTVYEDNLTDLGCIYISFSDFGDFNDIEISDNTGFFGAGIRFWQTSGMVVRNSEFSGNDAWYGAAIRTDMRAFAAADFILPEGGGLLVDSCLFDGNSITDPGNDFGYFGGAMFMVSVRGFKVSNSEFTGNTGNDLAGAIYVNNSGFEVRDTTDFVIDNSEFSGNAAEATSGSGGAFFTNTVSGVIRNSTIEDSESDNFSGAAYFVSSEMTLRNCLIQNNMTNGGGGGAILVGFNGSTTIEDSELLNNTANFGGAVSVQNDSTALTIINSTLRGNIAATGTGGAILGLSGTVHNISHSSFSQNQANASVGGAIGVSESIADDGLNMLTLNVDNSEFFLNTSTQGGAINIFNASGTMVNNLFYQNTANLNTDGEAGGGGAVSLNIFGDKPDQMTFINNTFGANTSLGIGSNLSLFQDSIAQATVELQNNISYDIVGTVGVDIEGENPGFLTVTSLGGNLFAGDLALEVDAVLTTDASDVVAPLATAADIWVNALIGDYHLADGSPAIDIAVPGTAPDEDIEGTPRPQGPASDAGSYEKMVVDTREEVIDDASQLIVLPNPVKSTLYLQMNNEWTGDLAVRIMDLNGRMLQTTQVQKFGQIQTFQVDLNRLPAGTYEVLVSNGSALLARQIVKQ